MASLLGARTLPLQGLLASLLGARTLLQAPGIAIVLVVLRNAIVFFFHPGLGPDPVAGARPRRWAVLGVGDRGAAKWGAKPHGHETLACFC